MVHSIHPDMPYTMYVPKGWRHRVCTCVETKYHTTNEGFVGFVCRNCGKYFRWSLLLCGGCGKKYLFMFSHPEWCPHTSRCLDCLNEGYVNTCDRNCYRKQFSDYKYDADRGPIAPKTEEQIDAELEKFTSITKLDTSNFFDF